MWKPAAHQTSVVLYKAMTDKLYILKRYHFKCLLNYYVIIFFFFGGGGNLCFKWSGGLCLCLPLRIHVFSTACHKRFICLCADIYKEILSVVYLRCTTLIFMFLFLRSVFNYLSTYLFFSRHYWKWCHSVLRHRNYRKAAKNVFINLFIHTE